MRYDEFKGMTKAELYRKAKSDRDLLMKRMKVLKQNLKKYPGRYSPFAYNSIKKNGGIPKVSTKMTRNELVGNLAILENYRNMKTSSSRGAKQHVNETVRTMLNLPKSGRLKAADKRNFDSAMQYVQDHPNALSDYWKAYEHYKEQVAYAMLPYETLLEDFQEKLSQTPWRTGYQRLSQITSKIDDLIENEYRQTQAENQLLDEIGRTGGFMA